eukprot:5354691-Pleurochrysis_carterae.AAC.1
MAERRRSDPHSRGHAQTCACSPAPNPATGIGLRAYPGVSPRTSHRTTTAMNRAPEMIDLYRNKLINEARAVSCTGHAGLVEVA